MIKTLHFKLVIVLEYKNAKTFSLKDTLKIGLKNFLWLKKLKIQFYGHLLLVILVVKKLLEHFIKRNFKKQTNKNLGEKVNYISNGKEYNNSFNSWIDKEDVELNSLELNSIV